MDAAASGGTTKTAMDILADKQTDIVSVTAGTSLQEAIETMVDQKVGSVVVKEEGEYVGLWTERDLLRDMVEPGFNPHTARVGDHMVRDIPSADHSLNPYELMDRFLGLRLRHLLVTREGQVVGLLSMGDVVRFCLQERTRELEALKETVNWEYYEEWNPCKKR